MKQKFYFMASMIYAILAVVFTSLVDNNIAYGIMAVLCLMGAAGFADCWSQEKIKQMELRSNADEDRPE